ncbi:MAG: four-carbon acid sugar kinase family protein [Burkholderiaceae bacterium]
MKPIVAIVADDLTGSGDTAVQFVRAGWVTHLSIGGARDALDAAGESDVEVLAVTTHSRPMPGDEAAAVVANEIAVLRRAGVRRLYKKVDSTLRGAFRAEIEATQQAWGEDAIVVVCPAFPATGRTVRDGTVFVDDLPVTQTSAATDPVTPVTEGHIPTLLQCAHVAQVASESADDLGRRIAAAGSIVVVDAQTSEDIDKLARAIVSLGDRAVPVGAGGLAIPLARLWASEQSRGPVVVVVTSQHSASRGQARALTAGGAHTWSPTLQALADDQLWKDWSAEVVAGVGALDMTTAPTVLLLAPEGRADGLDSEKVATRLGELAGELVRQFEVAGIVATGGDGASHTLQALSANGIALVDEVTGGVPLGRLTGGEAAGLPVVTKAGGFGAENVLLRAAQAIRERRF